MDYYSYVANLKKEIAKFVSLGGDIYTPRRQLPYYEKLRTAAKYAKEQLGKDLSIEDVYLECGIKFDRDFNRYENLMKVLKICADKDGYVDLATVKGTLSEQYQILKDLSAKTNFTPSEFLIVMTPFRTKEVITSGNYLENIRRGLSKYYPDGVVRDIKRQHNDVYEQIRHFQKYSPVPISYDESLEFFGFVNGNEKQSPTIKKDDIAKNEDEVLEDLIKLYPDRNIGHLITDNKTLYYQVIALARANDQTVLQWFDCRGFDYPFGQNAARLTRYKVDAAEHEKLLLGLKDKFLEEYNTENADNFDMFKINFEVAKRVSSAIHQEDEQTDAHAQPKAEKVTVVENNNEDQQQ